MKVLFTIFFLAGITMTNFAQNKWALVVGIGSYPQESGWRAIHGDNDIELIYSFLSKIGTEQEHIKILKNENATKHNIIAAFKWLHSHISYNDWVYIHLSGHGQLITDIDGDEESDCWDESFIPYDARKSYKETYHGENHLIDDEMNEWLMKLRKRIGKSGTLCVVLDACHSGDGSRYEDQDNDEISDAHRRGTSDCFIIPNTTSMGKHGQRQIDWICLSACKSYESNYECKINGRYYGRLSYALANVINPQIRVNELINAIKAQYDIIPIVKNRIQTLSVDVPQYYLDAQFIK